MNDQLIEYILGVDWGRQKIGLAIADDELGIATGLELVPARNFFARIEQLKNNYRFKKIILGSLFFDQGRFSTNRKLIEDFIQKLIKLGFKVELEEEMLSSGLARKNLIEAGKKVAIQQDDVEAARIILQSWIDKNQAK